MQTPISFFAMLDRIKYIERWSLMKNTEQENVKEHTFDVILLVHALYEIRRLYFSEETTPIDLATALLCALYHDTTEMITGDMPTPVKYFNRDMREQYQLVERYAVDAILDLLPQSLRTQYKPYFPHDQEDPMMTETWKLVKEADTLAAYLKCVAELKQGNREFQEAADSIREKLAGYQAPELHWFLQHALPAYELTLDQLRSPLL